MIPGNKISRMRQLKTKTVGAPCNMGDPPLHGQVCAPKRVLHCAQLTDDAPLLQEFYNDNPMEINEMRIMLRFTALAARVLFSTSQPM